MTHGTQLLASDLNYGRCILKTTGTPAGPLLSLTPAAVASRQRPGLSARAVVFLLSMSASNAGAALGDGAVRRQSSEARIVRRSAAPVADQPASIDSASAKYRRASSPPTGRLRDRSGVVEDHRIAGAHAEGLLELAMRLRSRVPSPSELDVPLRSTVGSFVVVFVRRRQRGGPIASAAIGSVSGPPRT